MSKSQNLRNALMFIEENINETITLGDVSQAAGYSVPQLYRLFKRLTGDTVNEYIVRRKIAKVAVDLKDRSKSIGEIAFEYGFESHDVFTRAFYRVYGITPNKYRRSSRSFPPLKRANISIDEWKDENQQMTFCVGELHRFDVIGMECKACIWDSDGAVGRLWSQFLNRVDEIEGVIGPVTMYGICEGDTCEENKLNYMAAVGVSRVEKVPHGMTSRTIRGQKYFQASVPEEISTPDAYTAAESYAKSLGYEIEAYAELEIYEEVFQDPESHRFKLYIPIK